MSTSFSGLFAGGGCAGIRGTLAGHFARSQDSSTGGAGVALVPKHIRHVVNFLDWYSISIELGCYRASIMTNHKSKQ